MSAEPPELSPAEVVGLFRECGALLQGHFLLTSGMHSPYYLQCARVLMEPARATRLLVDRLLKESAGEAMPYPVDTSTDAGRVRTGLRSTARS